MEQKNHSKVEIQSEIQTGMRSMKVPVALFVFRRLDTVKLILDRLRKAGCETLYIFADGAREGKEEEKKKVEEVRKYLRRDYGSL